MFQSSNLFKRQFLSSETEGNTATCLVATFYKENISIKMFACIHSAPGCLTYFSLLGILFVCLLPFQIYYLKPAQMDLEMGEVFSVLKAETIILV